MVRRRIAVLAAQCEEKTQAVFLEGLAGEAFSLNYDVCVFSMYQKAQDTPLRERGDSNIFRLINYDLFDAVIILQDTIKTPGIAHEIELQVQRVFHGPVLVIDSESRYFPSMMIDHKTPIEKLVSHLIEVHGYHNIAFLNGIPDHIHSKQRLSGYEHAMQAHGLTVRPDMIYDGDYWYTGGERVAKQLLAGTAHLPEAVVCANDCMAIGLCDGLTAAGIRIPEDIAVVGYDSIEEGQKSPVSITSADVPAGACGRCAAQWVDAKLSGRPVPSLEIEVPLFIGGSCGCPEHHDLSDNGRRKTWAITRVSSDFYSSFNHIDEDLLSQQDVRSFFNTVFQYTYQIRDFDHFQICLDENWKKPEFMIGEYARRHGYSKHSYPIVRCGASETEGNVVDFQESFETSMLSPQLYEDRDHPEMFTFTPLFFDDRCFGYAVISYGSEPKIYDGVYRLWMRSFMMGLESFNRQDALKKLLTQVEATQIRDGLTGLYNYKGFTSQVQELGQRCLREGGYVGIIAVDLVRLTDINRKFGRQTGDQAILKMARIIQDIELDGEICARMCNDEFLIACHEDSEKPVHTAELVDMLGELVQMWNVDNPENFQLEIATGSIVHSVTGTEALEELINEAVNRKNARKHAIRQQQEQLAGLSEEDQKRDVLVADILDNNRLIYFFQPIVNTRTGAVCAYEALMRADVEERISPPEILRSATRLNRLYDVEKATFFNVLDYIDAHPEQFENKRVFINSIPGYQLEGDDKILFAKRMKDHAGQIVVEFTEETEIGDEELAEIKANYEAMDIDTAIDDYGSGYSNVNNLLRYMPGVVKIDRMLLSDIQDNPQKQHFVKDIIEFAHDSDILALAEGVETSAELWEVIRLGADLIQGYYTAKPNAVPIQQIDERVAGEIVQYSQSATGRHVKKVYTIEGDSHISLVQLVQNRYTDIVIRKTDETYHHVEIVGVSGFSSNISIEVEEGYRGNLILDNACFTNLKGLACLRLHEQTELLVTLVHDNEMINGGICVPETAALTFEGDGNLSLQINSGKYYGIGNDLDSRHGDIIFRQDGSIVMMANGMKGVGVGSGLGGRIRIERGRYDFDLNGQDGIGIGSVRGRSELYIGYCDLNIRFGVAQGVVIGSHENDAAIFIENASVRIVGACANVVGIGSYKGKNSSVRIENANAGLNIRSKEGIVLGGMKSDVDISLSHVTVRIIAEGREIYAIGNEAGTARLHAEDSDLDVTVKNQSEVDLLVDEDVFCMVNGRSSFVVNDHRIDRAQISVAL